MTAAALEERVFAHYRLVGPLLDESFGLSRIVFANFPGGFGQPAHYHRTDVPLSASKLLWLCHRMYTVEFHSCAPLPEEPTRLRFARILLEDAPFDCIKLAALALRALLTEVALEAIPLLDGLGGIALWIPLADAPDAAVLREWLHGFCAHAVATHPELLTTQPNTHANGRVHLHVASNAPHKYSALPCSARPGRSSGLHADPPGRTRHGRHGRHYRSRPERYQGISLDMPGVKDNVFRVPTMDHRVAHQATTRKRRVGDDGITDLAYDG